MLTENSFNNGRLYLNITYSCKDVAKTNGACWDANMKKWFVYKNIKESQLKMLLSPFLDISVPKYITKTDEDVLSMKEKFKLMQIWNKDEILKNLNENQSNIPIITKSVFNTI